VPQATSYDIYRVYGRCGICELKIKIGSSNDTSHEDSLELGIGDYFYWVKAINPDGTSEFSLPGYGYIMVRPSAPTGVSASDGTYLNKVLIKWDKPPVASYPDCIDCNSCCPPVSDKKPKVTSYEIYRARFDGAPKTLIGTTSALQFFDTDLECSTCCPDAFVYWVKAVNAAGISSFSEEDEGYVYRTLRDPDVSATDGKSNCIWVTWNTVVGAKRYDVYRSGSLGGEKVLVCSVEAGCENEFKDHTATCPKVYYYWVKAVDSKGYTSCTFNGWDSGYCWDEGCE
jgi:hypothetical protein